MVPLVLMLLSAGPEPTYAPPPPDTPVEVPPLSPPPAPLAPGTDVGARRLFGVGLHGGLAVDSYSGGPLATLLDGCGPATAATLPGCASPTSAEGAGLGIYIRGGVQFNDRWGAELEGSFGTDVELEASLGPTVDQTYVRGALTAEATFGDWFTLALGPLVSGVVEQKFIGQANGVSRFSLATVTALGATLRTDLHLVPSRSRSGRSAFTLGVAFDLGATVGGSAFASSGVAPGAYATAGWAWY